MRRLRIAVLFDYLEEGRPSMDLVGSMIVEHLNRLHGETIEARAIIPRPGRGWASGRSAQRKSRAGMERSPDIGDNRDHDPLRPRGDDSMATAEALMTAEEFGQRPDPGHPEELAKGRVVMIALPDRRHGYVCCQAGYLISRFVDEHDFGRVIGNNSGVITERDPDTVRGADVAFYSYARLSRGPLSTGYGPEVPELVIEVRSSSDRWRDIHEKVAEYLHAGVLVVVVLDPGPQTAHVFGADDAPRTLGPEDELVLPRILEDFRARVGRFFE